MENPVDRPDTSESPPLSQPLALGPRTMANRLVFGPIVTNLGDGRAFSDRHVGFYRERAAGGCGLIVTEQASVHDSDWPYERCPAAAEAGPGWQRIAESLAPYDTLVVAGLTHAGGQASSAFSQRELLAPSDEPDVNTREVPKIMEPADIEAVIAGFGEAAAAASAAGLDGVEVNAGQHSLLRQFLSGLTNRRGDAYGEDRARLLREVIAEVRAKLAHDGILGLRLSCDELAPWAGITPEAAAELASDLAPVVDYLTVVRGGIFSVAETRPTAHHPPGFNIDLAGQIRAAVAGVVPIIAQGSIVSLDQATRAVTDGRCDAVEMTRAQLAEPMLGRLLDGSSPPRPCVRCNQLCNVRDNRNPIISCIANPRCGHETIDAPEPEPVAGTTGRSLLVVGGGPAGLEAARVAARLGHAVTLREASAGLGGMASIAATAPAHQPLRDLLEWLAADAVGNGAEIMTNAPVTQADVEEHDGPVVVACGSVPSPRTYDIDGTPRIVDGPDVLAAAANDRLSEVLDATHVAVWDPIGGPAGVAVTELIAANHGNVSLITPDAIAGNQLALTGDLAGANVRLQQAGVTIVHRQRLRAVDASRVHLVDTFTGATADLDVDLLVDVSARYPNDDLDDRPPGERPEPITRVGDAVAPRTVAEAIREGRAAALAIGPAPALAQTGIAP